MSEVVPGDPSRPRRYHVEPGRAVTSAAADPAIKALFYRYKLVGGYAKVVGGGDCTTGTMAGFSGADGFVSGLS
jgi:hypothetical protein